MPIISPEHIEETLRKHGHVYYNKSSTELRSIVINYEEIPKIKRILSQMFDEQFKSIEMDYDLAKAVLQKRNTI